MLSVSEVPESEEGCKSGALLGVCGGVRSTVILPLSVVLFPTGSVPVMTAVCTPSVSAGTIDPVASVQVPLRLFCAA